MTAREPIRLISDEALAELTQMAEELRESERQYDEWCARHSYRRNSFAPGRMTRMFEEDHAEALAVNEFVVIKHAARKGCATPEPGWSSQCRRPGCPGHWRTGLASADEARTAYAQHQCATGALA